MEESKYEELKGKYIRIPPAKRPNHAKLGVAAPFHHPWQELLHEWTQKWQGSETGGNLTKEIRTQFYVLRNQKALKELQSRCSSKTKKGSEDGHKPTPGKVAKKSLNHTSVSDSREHTSGEVDMILRQAPHCLVPVLVHMVLRGVPAQFSTICVPSSTDLEHLRQDPHCAGPVEPLHAQTHNTHDKTKKKAKTKPETVTKLTEVHLDNVVGNSCRDVIGFVTAGHFMLGSGQGAGMGYVAIQGLLQVVKDTPANSQAIVLVRANNSLQYRMAFLSVQTNW